MDSVRVLFASSPLTAGAPSVYFSIADVRWSDATELRKDLRLGEMPKVNACFKSFNSLWRSELLWKRCARGQ